MLIIYKSNICLYSTLIVVPVFTLIIVPFLLDVLPHVIRLPILHTQKRRDFCLKAINIGKHALCEKPMCLSLIEQEEILTAAKEKDVFFMEAIWISFTPSMGAIRKELTKHKYGKLKCFVANHMNNNIHLDCIRNKEGGEGAIFELDNAIRYQ